MSNQEEINDALERIHSFRRHHLITRTVASRLSSRVYKNVHQVNDILDQYQSDSKSTCMKMLSFLFAFVFSQSVVGLIGLFMYRFVFLPYQNIICSSHSFLVDFCTFSISYMTKDIMVQGVLMFTYGFFSSFLLALCFT